MRSGCTGCGRAVYQGRGMTGKGCHIRRENVTDTAIAAYVRCEAMKMNKFFMYIKKISKFANR